MIERVIGSFEGLLEAMALVPPPDATGPVVAMFIYAPLGMVIVGSILTEVDAQPQVVFGRNDADLTHLIRRQFIAQGGGNITTEKWDGDGPVCRLIWQASTDLVP